MADGYGTARLAAKDGESAIVARICEDFNLTPVLARAHYDQMARYFAEYGHMALRPGELCSLAVASDEPAGKPIIACRKVQAALELAAPEDQQALHREGLTAMRRGPLARLARQAQVQGGLLTVEDLAYLTCSSTATVKRDFGGLSRRWCGGADPGADPRHRPRHLAQGAGGAALSVGPTVHRDRVPDQALGGGHPAVSGRLPPDRSPVCPGGEDPRDPGGQRQVGPGHRRVCRHLRASPTRVPGRAPPDRAA